MVMLALHNYHPNVMATNNNNRSSVCGFPCYCLHCHTMINSEDQMSPHVSHDIYSQEAATSKVKSNLALMMTQINSKKDYLSQVAAHLDQFHESYKKCRDTVKAASQELISKITEHEDRLLQELDTYKDIEYRKYGLSPLGNISQVQSKLDSLNKTCVTLLDNSNNIDFLEQFKQERENINYSLLDLNNIDQADLNQNQPSAIDFIPVRCNTAFGTLNAKKSRSKWDNSYQKRPSLKTHLSFPPEADVHMFRKSDPQIQPYRILNGTSSQTVKEKTVRKPIERKMSLQMPGYQHNNSQFIDLDNLRSTHRTERLPSCEESIACIDEENVEHLQCLWAVDSEGPKPGQINCPSDVAFLPDNTLVVCDRGNMRLQLFNTKGEVVKIIAEKKIKPCRINVTANGNIIMTDTKENNVRVYDKRGHCVSALGKKLFKSAIPFKAPCGIACSTNKQYVVSDLEINEVQVYNFDGKLLHQAEFKKPSYISANKSGKILVSDNLGQCVKVLDSSLQYLFQCTHQNNDGNGKTENYLSYPSGACFDAAGNIYVADWGSHTVTLFNNEGLFVKQLLNKEDGLYHPAGLAVSDRYLAVTSFCESQSSVMMFKLY